MITKKFSLTFILFFSSLSSLNQIFPQFQIPFSVISSGGISQSNSSYYLVGTIGQTIIGNSTSAAHQLQAGFWQLYYQSVISDVTDKELLPAEFKLEQNFPNPFNPSTIIRFALPERTTVLLKIYDLLGEEVITLVNEEKEAGWYNVNFNATGFASGFYIYRMQTGQYTSIKKMLMIK